MMVGDTPIESRPTISQRLRKRPLIAAFAIGLVIVGIVLAVLGSQRHAAVSSSSSSGGVTTLDNNNESSSATPLVGSSSSSSTSIPATAESSNKIEPVSATAKTLPGAAAAAAGKKTKTPADLIKAGAGNINATTYQHMNENAAINMKNPAKVSK